MPVKEFFKDAAKKGTKLAGKTFVRSVFDIKTWILIYMTVIASRAYNKLGKNLNVEAEINRAAAQKIEERVATPEGMAETCKKYDLTEQEVKEVIGMQRNFSNTQKAVMKTAQDSKKSWRDWLPGAKALRDKGARDGLGVESNGQLDLAMDAYEAAEAELKSKQRAKSSSSQKTEGR